MNDVERISRGLDQVEAHLNEFGPEVREFRARLQSVEQLVAMREQGGFRQGSTATLGAQAMNLFAESPAFGHLLAGNAGTAKAALPTSINAILTTDGWAGDSADLTTPGNPTRGGLIIEPQRRLRLLDVLPRRSVSSDAVEFVRVSATGDAAEQTEQGQEKAAIALGGELVTAQIATVAGYTQVARQTLADQPALQQVIDRVMRFKVLSKLESLLIAGDTSTGKIDGLLNQATPFVAAIGATPADILGEAITELDTEGYSPSAIMMHPNDWYAIRIERHDAAPSAPNTLYVFGSPAETVRAVLWGLPVVTSTSVPQGTALVADLSFVTLLDREMASVLVSLSHGDTFIRNVATVLCELRAGLEVADQGAVLSMDLNPS